MQIPVVRMRLSSFSCLIGLYCALLSAKKRAVYIETKIPLARKRSSKKKQPAYKIVRVLGVIKVPITTTNLYTGARSRLVDVSVGIEITIGTDVGVGAAINIGINVCVSSRY